jgi:subtilisin-like proprotein convertase family protein
VKRLEAFVTGPDGTQWQLFNVLGDNDLTGLITDIEGDWLLEVFDTRKKKEGTLQSWSITVDY